MAQAAASHAAFRDAEKELAEVRRIGCRLLHWEETEYPKRLLEIYDPPTLLYVLGDIQVLDRHAVSIVGTRRPTPYRESNNREAGAGPLLNVVGLVIVQRPGARSG